MKRATAIAVAAALLLCGLAAALAWFDLSERAAATASRPAWLEVAWPFRSDQGSLAAASDAAFAPPLLEVGADGTPLMTSALYLPDAGNR
jgi:hypothetical protein